MNQIKNIGVLTSGGDSPGMNAAIRAVVKTGLNNNLKVFGIYDGFKGMIENRIRELNFSSVNNIIQIGGTILGTARCEQFKTKEGRLLAFQNLQKHFIDALIVIGGDGSFAGAHQFSLEHKISVIGIPGTIDNDIEGTDFSIGFDTCLNTVIEAVDKIRDTASSHHRVFFIEVMGRASGQIALNSAIACGAESVLIPETITDIQTLAQEIKTQNKGTRSSIIIVAEGDDEGGAKEILNKVKPFLPEYDLRFSVLGHIQRGGNPSAFDRILATKFGVKAVDLILNNKSSLMVGQIGSEIISKEFVQKTTDSGKELSGIKDMLKLLLTKY
ncbi:MAG TPA: 6-phosphofructokinase [Fluviicola sp.]|nr:6-phosphofructokinase [Fluviicola sp.]